MLNLQGPEPDDPEGEQIPIQNNIPIETRSAGQLFSAIFSATKANPRNIENDRGNHLVQAIRMHKYSRIQTITHTLEGISTLILYNPGTDAITARTFTDQVPIENKVLLNLLNEIYIGLNTE